MNNTNISYNMNKTYIIFFIIVFVIFGILFSTEFLLYKICKIMIKYTFFAILLVIFLHYIFMRSIILSIAFPGSSKLIKLQTQYELGKKQAEIILEILEDLSKVIDSFTKSSDINDMSLLINIKKSIRNSMDYINYFVETFRKMKSQFNNLNQNQNQFYLSLLMLKDDIKESKILQYISNEIAKSKANNLISDDEIQIDQTNQIFNKILLNIKNIKEILNEYIGYGKKWYQLAYIRNMFKNILFGTIEQFKVELPNYFFFEEKSFLTSDNQRIEYIIIHPEEEKKINNNENNKKNALIICGPNGSAYQLFSKNIHLDYYLRRGLDIICWNYRGYGFSTGKPSYNNIRTDVIELYEEIKKLDKYKKIGVHGISIGGIPACYLSSQKKDIQLLISDRNFGQIEYIIRTLPIGYFLINFYKIFLFQKTRTIEDYLNTKCYKIVLNDPMDNIVKDCGSLKTLTSEEIINSYLFKHNLSSPANINNENIPLSSYSSSFKNDGKNKKNSLDLLLDKKEDKEIFIHCLLDICDEVNLNKTEINNMNYKDSSNEIIVDEVEKSRLKLLKKIRDIFSNFSSGGDSLSTLFDIQKTWRKIIFIINFFNNLIIWGNKNYDENEPSIHYFTTEHLNSFFSDINNRLELFLKQNDIIKCINMKIYKDVEKFKNFMKTFEKNFETFYIKRENPSNNTLNLITNISSIINNNNNSVSSSNKSINKSENTLSEINNHIKNYENSLIKLGRGNLITLSCGHNGGLNFEELETLMKHMNLSKIFEVN